MTPMTVTVIAALQFPDSARVGQRVPKKLLLENTAPTASDKCLIMNAIEKIQWLALAGKESTCVFRDSVFADDVAKTNLTAILEQHGTQNVRSL